MRLILALFAIMIISSIVKADDYFLSEEEDQQVKEESNEGDFMKQFSCMVGVQRYFYFKTTDLQKYETKENYQTNLKRLKARMFSKCLSEISQEVVDVVSKAGSSKDFEQVDFSAAYLSNVGEVFSETDPVLSDEDKSNFKAMAKVEQAVKEMQRKSKRDNPDKQDDEEEEETWNGVRKSKEGPSLAGVSLSNKSVVFTVVISLIVLILVLARLSSSLFEEKKKDKKKDKKNKN